ncbi:MAG TPA: hypothetical protein VK277_13325 [Acidimicrobiales bacterium]|nr:hypothetical protein [Acidimicrobiales bacterium]
MLYLSMFRPDPNRFAEFLACLWQGDVPATLRLERWLYVGTGPREMALLWEGEDEAFAYIQRAFSGFGELSTEPVTDATPGLEACFDRSLEMFAEWFTGRGATPDEVANQLDVRRRGLEASSREEASAAGRAWAAEQGER